MSFNWWMNKQTVVHPYDGILYSAIKQKELLVHSTIWMNTQMYYAK